MTDIDVYQPPAQLGQYQPRMAMTPADAQALDDQLTQCIKAILHEGTDYGLIPGTNEKSLWRPGAQKMLLWFGLSFTCDRIYDIDTDDDGHRLGVTYRATIYRRFPDGSKDVAATCEGYAGYDESKFYKTAEQVQREAEDKERYWAKKDGRVANPTKWKNLGEYRAPWNTVIKRAQKRAIVGGTLDATSAGGRFNQDREEDDHAPVPQDDGPSWTETAIARASVFTDIDECRELYLEAAEAHKKGLCNRKQQDLVQNTVAKLARKLQAVTVVEVEDLASKAEADHAQDAAEGTQDDREAAAGGEAGPDDPPEDALPVEDPPDWPEAVKPGTGTPKGK